MAEATCAYCGEEPATFFLIIGDEPGKDIGALCFAGMGLEVAREVLTPDAIWGVIGPLFVQGGGEAAAPPKRATRARKGKAAEPVEPVAEQPAAEGVEAEKASGQD